MNSSLLAVLSSPFSVRKVYRVCLLATVALPLAAIAADPAWLGDKTDVVIGVGAQYAPRYAGADAGRVQAVPVLSVQRGLLFFDTTRGGGIQFQTGSGLYLSQSLGYDLGRLQSDSDWRPGSARLAGMGDVPGSLTARTLLMQKLGPVSLSAEAEFALRDGARRNRYRAGAEFAAWTGAHDGLSVSADTHWGDRRYDQAYFGVTEDQAARSRFDAFRSRSGLYACALGATWEHRFDAHWASTLQLAGTRYVDRAADSPVVERRNAFAATAAVTYTY